MNELSMLLDASDEEILAASNALAADFDVEFAAPVVVANTEEAG